MKHLSVCNFETTQSLQLWGDPEFIFRHEKKLLVKSHIKLTGREKGCRSDMCRHESHSPVAPIFLWSPKTEIVIIDRFTGYDYVVSIPAWRVSLEFSREPFHWDALQRIPYICPEAELGVELGYERIEP